jgi:hypothetical protein
MVVIPQVVGGFSVYTGWPDEPVSDVTHATREKSWRPIEPREAVGVGRLTATGAPGRTRRDTRDISLGRGNQWSFPVASRLLG